MIYIATLRDDKLFIATYETEEPSKNLYFGLDIDSEYEKDYKHWQSFKREYRVRESDKWEIINELTKNWVKSNSSISFHKEPNKGIDCTFLKDRLKLKAAWNMKLSERVEIWTLLPLEDKKENEAGKWISIKDQIPDTSVCGVSNRVLAYGSGYIAISNYDSDRGRWTHVGPTPTHWMPLPEPPNS